MNNDLISRNSLKEKIENIMTWHDEYEESEWLSCAEEILNLLTNEPTVERPQGEWKSLMWVSGEIIGECPFCDGEQVAENYCSYCGAKLHGRN